MRPFNISGFVILSILSAFCLSFVAQLLQEHRLEKRDQEAKLMLLEKRWENSDLDFLYFDSTYVYIPDSISNFPRQYKYIFNRGVIRVKNEAVNIYPPDKFQDSISIILHRKIIGTNSFRRNSSTRVLGL